METVKEKILPVIYEAGKIMLSAHDIESGDNVKAKAGDANFVTVFDVRVQDFLIKTFSTLFSGAKFFAEEKENSADDLESEYCFIIDPIDGTANFMHEYRHSAISVALVSHGEVVFGAVYDPYLDEMFCAEKGKGAMLNGRAIHVSDRSIEVSLLAMGSAPYYKRELGGKTFALGKALYDLGADIRRGGSAAIDLCYLAAARHDLFFEFMLSPWDFAAAQLIIKEAGGIISTAEGDSLCLCAQCSVIAANKVIYPTLLKTAKPIYTGEN